MKEITIITTVEVTDTIKLRDEYAEEFLLMIKENHATERAIKKFLDPTM